MVGVQAAAIRLFEDVVIRFCLQTVEGKFNVTYAAAIGTKDALDGRVRSISRAFAVASALIDAHHFEGDIT